MRKRYQFLKAIGATKLGPGYWLRFCLPYIIFGETIK